MRLGLRWKHGPVQEFDFTKEACGPAIAMLFRQAFDSNVQLVAHREATAQHFDGPGGDFSDWANIMDQRTAQCVLIEGPATGWRGRVIYYVAASRSIHRGVADNKMPSEIQPKEVVVVLYHHFKQTLQERHVGGKHIPDCTHNCGSPFMYMTLWISLRIAMDRQYRHGIV